MRPGRKEIENKANEKIKSTYDAAHNENSVVENARNDTTTAKHSDRVKADIKKETTGQSTMSTEPGTSYVETSTSHSGGASTMLGFEPLSSSDKTTDSSTSTTDDVVTSVLLASETSKRNFCCWKSGEAPV